jgi:hypothetical protein
MNFAPERNIGPVLSREPLTPKTARSPVGEPLGETLEPKHQLEKERVRSETALEFGSNY